MVAIICLIVVFVAFLIIFLISFQNGQDAEYGMFFVIVASAIILALALTFVPNKKRKSDEEEDEEEEYIKEHDIHCDIDYQYNNELENIQIRFIVDIAKSAIFLRENSSSYVCIPFSEIIGYEILIDSEVTGGVGRAIAGAVLAGGVGAVVGATTAHKQITSYSFVIYRNSLEAPSCRVSLIKYQTKTDSQKYKDAAKFAQDINASIKAIIEQNKNKSNGDASVVTGDRANTDFSQELRKYKELLDEGIITQDEFQQKKKALLNL